MGGIGSGGMVGNKSRTKMRKPPGSGTQRQIGERVMFANWINKQDLDALKAVAQADKVSVAYLVRLALTEYLDSREDMDGLA